MTEIASPSPLFHCLKITTVIAKTHEFPLKKIDEALKSIIAKEAASNKLQFNLYPQNELWTQTTTLHQLGRVNGRP